MSAVRCLGCNHILATRWSETELRMAHRGREAFGAIHRIRCERCGVVTPVTQPVPPLMRRGPALGEVR